MRSQNRLVVSRFPRHCTGSEHLERAIAFNRAKFQISPRDGQAVVVRPDDANARSR